MQEKARQDSIDKASFKVGVMPTLDCLPVFVAQDEKLFDSLGSYGASEMLLCTDGLRYCS